MTYRDTLFGDLPPEQWLDSVSAHQPVWELFNAAYRHLEIFDTENAVACWKRIVQMKHIESRHLLQAWYFLRLYHCRPKERIAKSILGVIFEVAMAEGLDVLAAYRDHTSRYINFSGKTIIWDRPDATLDELIDSLLSVAEKVVTQLQDPVANKLTPPTKGKVQISFLTPSGIYFGHGLLTDMAVDPLGAPLINAGTVLMQALIKKKI